MITLDKGRKYEVFIGGTIMSPTYYAHTHCWCGSTLSSGEWVTSIGEAIGIARSSITEHDRRNKHAQQVSK